MQPQDYAGRIPRDSFIISISVLLAPAVLGVLMRLFIRFRVQRQRLSVDDWLLVLALCFLLASIVIMYRKVIDPMYLLVAMELGIKDVAVPADIIEVGYVYHEWSAICLTVSWCAFGAVKLSFLFFFKKLIDRIKPWQIYWWAITVYTAAVLIYGSLIFFLSCPYYYDMRQFTCSVGSKKGKVVAESIILMVLDTLGDFLILAIPVNIIWKIRVRWTQRIILTLSLCLTVVMIILSIVRVSGLVYRDIVDTVWETYWQFLSAEVGVFLAAAVSFRSFFVAQNRTLSPPPFSVKRFLQESFSSPKRRHPDNMSSTWIYGNGSEMEVLASRSTTREFDVYGTQRHVDVEARSAC
ncbi:hypothetical protein BO83DRAFT_427980 [Aspergillus eucalypticola CBS 122712]|uniref:Rhodopsin domain-containing protein n=1 Tax=Aspergillus eucalypticola (strain CBS 122712 / IBT 29274) TaxID=1448314 RepID=A0A317VD66_ASPEC|nr:uncharacterized protein BO83DRAFT_427980 [Aspergillus eucalypticola CBS 122712]PWY71379.1 hypothetical protein BO83DRAFT_427980 [Aspergillus eucalypticola CBS 122712]